MMEKSIKTYLRALELGSLKKLKVLFSKEAVVYSPLYGKMSADIFYKDLFSDTQNSEITLFDVYTNKKQKKATCHFEYQWTLANGEKASFECVDIFEFDEKGKISQLKIIYDTVNTRDVWRLKH